VTGVQTCALPICPSIPRITAPKLVVAFFGAVILGMLGLVPPALITSSHVRASDVAEGIVAVFATAVAGVSVGALFVRPIFKQSSWSVLCSAVVGLATILIPHCPPTRQIMVLFSSSGDIARGVVFAGIEAVGLAAVLVGASLAVAWRRT